MQGEEKLFDVKMEELDYVWTCEEAIEELKQNLLYTTIELESLQKEASEKIQKQKEDIKCLINLLRIAYQQRDEAKEQLQILLISPTELKPILPHTQPESPLVLPAKVNSSITESNSLSETYNSHYSNGSPPVDSFFNPVSSHDLSTINVVDCRKLGTFVNQPFVNGSNPSGLVPSGVPKIDRATAVIDSFVKGKALPQKGKLMQTVMEAGPLLQTLLLAGPLPRWRNPPPMQPFKIPPVIIRSSEAVSKSSNVAAAAANPICVVQKPISAPSTFTLSSQMYSASIPCNFSSRISGQNNLLVSSDACTNNLVPSSKRQRFH